MLDNLSKLRIIYIGGLEHSGSTLLGLILDNHTQIICVGELSHLARVGWQGDQKCSCGLQIRDCTFWTKVRTLWEEMTNEHIDKLIEIENNFDLNRQLPRILFERYIQSSAFKDYCEYSLMLFRAIKLVSGRSIIVDTSKRASRALALSSINEIDLRLIHLIRDARGVAYSSGKPKRISPKPWWISALRWDFINLAFEFIKPIIGDKMVLQLRYEDLISNPEDTIRRLGDFIGLDTTLLTLSVSRNEPLVADHIGAGNSFLITGNNFYLNSRINWINQMPLTNQKKVWMLTKKRMIHYGYKNK
jgi:hypothetical protein